MLDKYIFVLYIVYRLQRGVAAYAKSADNQLSVEIWKNRRSCDKGKLLTKPGGRERPAQHNENMQNFDEVTR